MNIKPLIHNLKTKDNKYFIYLIIFILSHIIVFTLLPTFTRLALDSKGDMLENFIWGQEYQLGYYKHPPLFAWVTSLWFEIFPNNNFFYFLLSQINIAIGFFAVYFLAKEIFKDEKKAFISVILLELIPFYNVLGIKFNANSILLSIWPLFTLFFYKALKKDKIQFWILTGLFATLSILSKYYSAVLMIPAAIIFILKSNKENLLKKKGPYIAGIVFLITIIPHIIWIFKTDFLIFNYLDEQKQTGLPKLPIKFGFSQLFYLIIPIIIAIKAYKVKLKNIFLNANFKDFDRFFIYIINILPCVLTIILGVVFKLKTSSVWGIPLWFAFPIWLIMNRNKETIGYKKTLKSIYVFFIIALSIIPIKHFGSLTFNKDYQFPGNKLSKTIKNKWQIKYNSQLKYAAGDMIPSFSTAFYSKNKISVLINYDFKISPWISQNDIKNFGIAIICEKNSKECIKKAKAVFPKIENWDYIKINDFEFKYRFINDN